MPSNEDIERKRHFVTDNTIKCKCGHSLFFKRNRMLCTWCGRFVFKDEREEFKYTLNRLIIQKNRRLKDGNMDQKSR